MSIQCTFQYGSYYSVGSVYHCEGTLVSGGSIDYVTSVSGSHQIEKSDLDVLGLSMPSQNVQYFPRNIAAFFPNLIAFYFINNSISSVSQDHFADFPNLEYVDIQSNSLTSLDSNLFAGLNSLKLIRLQSNNIMNIGHDFVLPNTGEVNFNSNTCISGSAGNADQMNALRFRLLVNCPPTIQQIEASLESRSNLITKVNTQVQNLQQSHIIVNGQVQRLIFATSDIEESQSEMKSEVENLTNAVADLENRNLQLTNEVTGLQQRNGDLTDEVSALTVVVTDVQQSNVELINRNLHLETRIGYLDIRAGYLEGRVAMLESIIENKLGLKMQEVISQN